MLHPATDAGFGFDAEVLLRARRLGWRVAEVGVVWRHAENSRVSPIRDSLGTLVDLVRLRLASRLTRLSRRCHLGAPSPGPETPRGVAQRTTGGGC